MGRINQLTTWQARRRTWLRKPQLLAAAVATAVAGVMMAVFAHAETTTVSYYVNPVTGFDANDGSAGSPFKTIQHALDLAAPGTTINLAAGRYTEALTTKYDGDASNPVVIQGPETGKDISGRYQAVVYGTGGHVLNINNSYYTIRGFTIDGQAAINRTEYPTDFTQTRAFKDSVQSRVVDSKLIYVGASDTSHDITGVNIDDMWLQGSGGECVRFRNRATNNLVTNTSIRWCGMNGKGDDVSQYKYHNGEGVYIGTSPKSTTQPMYANDASTGNVVSNSSILTYGSECFDVKENGHDNTLRNSQCMYNDEPTSFDGSNLELRGDHNTVEDTSFDGSNGYNMKLSTDAVTYDKGGNAVRRSNFSNSAGAAIKNKLASATMGEFCGSSFTNNTGGQLTGNSVGDPARACISPDTQAPAVTVTVPANGAGVGAATTVTLTAAASDDRAVTRLEFLVDGVPLALDTASPYQANWTTPSTLGSHQILARAYDDYGNVAISQNTVNVVAPDAPTNLTATAASGSSVNLSWTASANVPVAAYDIYRNNTKVGSTATVTYVDSGLAASTGYSYYVRARDVSGNLSTASNTASVTTPAATNIAFEAESGTLTSPMVSAADAAAQGGRYIYQSSSFSTGKATYTFNVATGGTYKMQWRTIAPSSSSNSFTFAFDSASTQLWSLPLSSTWQWNGWTGASFNLTAGTHKLTVYRSESNTKLDAINLTLDVATPVTNGTAFFEAESGVLTSGLTATSDSTASGGKYVKATGSGGTATYTVQVPASGTYMIAGYIKAPTSSSDSFNIKADSGSYVAWDLQDPTTSWTYDATSNPTFSLAAGTHKLTLQYRENGASVDRLILVKQ